MIGETTLVSDLHRARSCWFLDGYFMKSFFIIFMSPSWNSACKMRICNIIWLLWFWWRCIIVINGIIPCDLRCLVGDDDDDDDDDDVIINGHGWCINISLRWWELPCCSNFTLITCPHQLDVELPYNLYTTLLHRLTVPPGRLIDVEHSMVKIPSQWS